MDWEHIREHKEWLRRNGHLVKELQQRKIRVLVTKEFHEYITPATEPGFVEALVASLPHAPSELDLRGYIGLLEDTTAPYPAEALVRIFRSSESEFVRFDILQTLMFSNATGGDEFIESLLEDRSTGNRRNANVVASLAAHSRNGARLLRIMVGQGFERFPFAILYGLYKFGQAQDLAYLLGQSRECPTVKPESRREFDKLFDKVLRRLTRLAERKKLRTK